jgi:hypothetical protein
MRAIMLRAILAVVLLAGLPAGTARADGGPFGLGLILGSPTGIDGKLYFNKQNALDFAVGEAFVNERGFHLHADYLWHPVMLTQDEAFFLPFYLGIGGRFLDHERHTDSAAHLGVRAPLGILFDFKRIPLDVFLEVALVVDIIRPSEDDIVDLNVGVGVRYYF